MWSLTVFNPYWMGPATGIVAYAATRLREFAVVSLSVWTTNGTVASFAGDQIIVNISRKRLATTRLGRVRTSGSSRKISHRLGSAAIIRPLRSNRSPGPRAKGRGTRPARHGP